MFQPPTSRLLLAKSSIFKKPGAKIGEIDPSDPSPFRPFHLNAACCEMFRRPPARTLAGT
jgi:hypothetical protein